MRSRPYSSLSRRQRRQTTVEFACYLLAGVQRRFGHGTVAILWTEERSNWRALRPYVDLWPASRDARRYAGPFPIVAHPPCGPWGKMKAWCQESREHGVMAMKMVHQWGGVVEQPLGSSLFRELGEGGAIEQLNQGDYGFPCKKPTLLYWFERR